MITSIPYLTHLLIRLNTVTVTRIISGILSMMTMLTRYTLGEGQDSHQGRLNNIYPNVLYDPIQEPRERDGREHGHMQGDLW